MVMVTFLIGFIVGVLILFILIKRREAKNKERNELKENVFQIVEQSKDIIYYYQVKPIMQHQYTSPSVDYFLGEGTLDLLNQDAITPFVMIHPDDRALMVKKITNQLEYCKPIIQRLKGTSGVYHTFEEYATPIYENGELVAIQGVMRNIDEKIKLEADLRYQVVHDSLTCSYNRYYFDQQMQWFNQEIDCTVALILCDLDGLKQVNDKRGHLDGDQLIQSAANVLEQYFGEHGFVARIGGDEFAVMMTNYCEAEIRAMCEGFDEFLSCYNDEVGISLSISLGYAYSEHSIDMMEKLYVAADQRMYKQKLARYEKC